MFTNSFKHVLLVTNFAEIQTTDEIHTKSTTQTITVSWTKVAGNVKHYVVKYWLDGEEPVTKEAVKNMETVLDNLIPGMTYNIEITTLAGNGKSSRDKKVKQETTGTIIYCVVVVSCFYGFPSL